MRNSRASHSSSVKFDFLPLATPGTLAVVWPCVKQRQPGSTSCSRAFIRVSAARLRLSLRRLRTDDTLRTFANERVAQHPVDPLGIGVGVPRLLVGRATGNQEAARACGVPRLRAQRAWSMTFHSQITSRFVARAWPGGGGRVESCESLLPVANVTQGLTLGPGR